MYEKFALQVIQPEFKCLDLDLWNHLVLEILDFLFVYSGQIKHFIQQIYKVCFTSFCFFLV